MAVVGDIGLDLTPEGRAAMERLNELADVTIEVGYQADQEAADDETSLAEVAYWNHYGTLHKDGSMSIKATVNPAADTAEITKEELIADAREHETSLLDGLLTAAGFKTAEDCIKKVVISRGGKDLFSFHIHPLSEEDYNACRKKFTKYVKSKVQGGIRVPEEVHAVNYRAALIYAATIPEDQENVWDNKALWKKLDLATGYEAVNALLMAGEKEAVLSLIDQISGYELSEEDVAKN